MNRTGKVYIVGAGPGAADLITVRGVTCLRESDVILHDRLIDHALLAEAPAGAEIISVGKDPGNEDLQQERIHSLMVEKAREGKTVCRLKGGDPFVFGRGGEEAHALVNAEITFEIVPGVSSAIAVPAAAGIPVTHRALAHSFMVITGSRSMDLSSGEWSAARDLIRAGGTVVVLMGLARIQELAENLIAGNCPPAIPAAVISNGTRPNQVCRVGTLANIAERAAGLASPAVIMIGEVVELRNGVFWAEISALQ